MALSWRQSCLHGKYRAFFTLPKCTYSTVYSRLRSDANGTTSYHERLCSASGLMRTHPAERQLACHLKLQQHSCSTVGRQSPAPLEQEALSHLLRPGLLLWRARAIGNMTCVFFRGSWLEALLPRTWDWLWLSEAHRQLKRNDSSIHYTSKKSRHYRQYSYSWTDNRIKYSSNWLNRPPAHNAQ